MLDKWRTSKLKVGYKSTVKYHIVLESKTNGTEINRYVLREIYLKCSGKIRRLHFMPGKISLLDRSPFKF